MNFILRSLGLLAALWIGSTAGLYAQLLPSFGQAPLHVLSTSGNAFVQFNRGMVFGIGNYQMAGEVSYLVSLTPRFFIGAGVEFMVQDRFSQSLVLMPALRYFPLNPYEKKFLPFLDIRYHQILSWLDLPPSGPQRLQAPSASIAPVFNLRINPHFGFETRLKVQTPHDAFAFQRATGSPSGSIVIDKTSVTY